MNFRWGGAAALLAAVGAPVSDAFVERNASPLVVKPSTKASSLAMGPPSDPSAPLTEQFGEGSRKYRRTVYTHDQWVKHRSSDRFVNNLGTLFQSGIYKQVGQEVFATVSIAVSVCVWNALVGGYQDFSGVMHDPVLQESWAMKVGLPMEAFTILSPSLGLLLVFRTNSSYNRWDEARKFWGLNINHTRDLNRMAAAWYGNQSDFDDTKFFESSTKKLEPVDPVERAHLLGQVSLMTWAFVRSMKRHLSPPAEDEENYVAEIKSRLDPEQAEALISATHRPNRALYDLSVAIEKLPMHFVRKNSINNNLSIFEDTLGGSERLLSSPVPLFYSRHTARFLATWLLLLPLGLYGQFGNSWNHAMMIPATAFISVCLFGIEELATQLEEPFTILPMQGFCDKIGANCDEIVSWAGEGREDETVLTTDKLVEEPVLAEDSTEESNESVKTPGEEDVEVGEPDADETLVEVSSVEKTVQEKTSNGTVKDERPELMSTQPDIENRARRRMSLRERLGQIEERLSQIEEKGNAVIGKRLSQIEERGNAVIEKRLSQIEEKGNAVIEKRLSQVEERGNTVIEKRLSQIEEWGNAVIEKRLSQIEERGNTVIEKRLSQIEERGNAVIEERLSQIKERGSTVIDDRPSQIEENGNSVIEGRLSQIEEGGSAIQKSFDEEQPIDKVTAKTETEASLVEDFLPEEKMERTTNSQPKNRAESRPMASLSLRELVSRMN